MKTIAVIEDDVHIGNILEESLQKEGYQTCRAYSGTEAKYLLKDCKPDLILLDLMLPGIAGEELLLDIRNIPVIVMSAKAGIDDKVTALLGGAADYITKPFSIKLVLKRVEALFRRTEAADMDTDTIRYKKLQISAKQRQVLVSGAEVILTQSEFDILLLFLKNQGRVFTRDELLNLVWGYEFIGEEKSVNFHIMNLRKKLGVDYIETVRGVGYKIAKENQ